MPYSNTAIKTDKAPAPVATYSQARLTTDATRRLSIAGVIALKPEGGQVTGSIEDQTHAIMQSLGAILAEANMTFQNLTHVTVYVTDLANAGVIDEIYQRFIGSDAPARAMVQVVALPRGAIIEITAFAEA
ncbi:Rid family detoxifying hydrolase [Patescibacteria group bacterium]